MGHGTWDMSLPARSESMALLESVQACDRCTHDLWVSWVGLDSIRFGVRSLNEAISDLARHPSPPDDFDVGVGRRSTRGSVKWFDPLPDNHRILGCWIRSRPSPATGS